MQEQYNINSLPKNYLWIQYRTKSMEAVVEDSVRASP